MEDHDPLHAARALLGGRPINITTDSIFAQLEADPRISISDMRQARRIFDALEVGMAVESLEKPTPDVARNAALFRLARAIRPHLATEPGWFRFLLSLGKQQGDSPFRLSYPRRPQSGSAQPKSVLDRTTQTRRALNDMLVAGAILHRIEAAKARGEDLLVKEAIEAAINDEDIEVEEEAARLSWHRFCNDCAALTSGQKTYRLERYDGSISKYVGRWVALPDNGSSSHQLPSRKGGARRKT